MAKCFKSRLTGKWLPKHDPNCCCDHCTGQRSWTSTEEYLRWSAGAEMWEPEYDKPTPANSSEVNRKDEDTSDGLPF